MEAEILRFRLPFTKVGFRVILVGPDGPFPEMTRREREAARKLLGRWDGIGQYIRASSEEERLERLLTVWKAHKHVSNQRTWRFWRWRLRRL